MTDRGLGANPEKKSLLSAASKVITLTPTIGTELHGIDLGQLSDDQKDELLVLIRAIKILSHRLCLVRSLLIAERGVVCKWFSSYLSRHLNTRRRKFSATRRSISISSWTSPATGARSTDTRPPPFRKSKAWKRSTVRLLFPKMPALNRKAPTVT